MYSTGTASDGTRKIKRVFGIWWTVVDYSTAEEHPNTWLGLSSGVDLAIEIETIKIRSGCSYTR